MKKHQLVNSIMSVVLTNSIAHNPMMPGNDVIANKVHFTETKQTMNENPWVWKLFISKFFSIAS